MSPICYKFVFIYLALLTQLESVKNNLIVLVTVAEALAFYVAANARPTGLAMLVTTCYLWASSDLFNKEPKAMGA